MTRRDNYTLKTALNIKYKETISPDNGKVRALRIRGVALHEHAYHDPSTHRWRTAGAVQLVGTARTRSQHRDLSGCFKMIREHFDYKVLYLESRYYFFKGSCNFTVQI